MKWTWESFGIYIEPDRSEPETLEPAANQLAQFDPTTIESVALESVMPEVTTLEPEAIALETISSLSSVPAGAQRVQRIIRQCLHLHEVAQIEMQFYEATGKCAVIVQTKEVNPTWQEVLEASRRSGWEVEVFAALKFERLKRSAFQDFKQIHAITPALAQSLIDQGFFTLQDLAAVDVKILMRLCGLDRVQAKEIIRQAEFHSEQMDL